MSGPGDFFKAAGGILAQIAPSLASAVGGPFAGLATQKILGALGLSEDTSKDDMMQAIANANPEQLARLKEVDNTFKIEMKRLDVDIMRLEAEDTASARRREVDTQDWTPRLIAALIIGLYMTVQIYILGNVVDATMREILLRSMGTLDASLAMILSYYFGSSIGSHNKDATINKMQDDK